VRLLAAKESYWPAAKALPWVALGWALYGLLLVLITVAGRAKVTSRNFPATGAGLVANVVLLVVLVGPLGIAGAGIALCGSYVVIITILHLLTRRLFHVPFEVGRMGAAVLVLAGVAVFGELVVPATGAGPLLIRLALAAAVPPLLVAAQVITPAELRQLARRARAARATSSRSG
jgi:O-antigen/teichoic acid export membrane protein